MKPTCAICKRVFVEDDEFTKFVRFTNKKVLTEETSFVVCREDIDLIIREMDRLTENVDSVKEHVLWRAKQRVLLDVAKGIFKRCACGKEHTAHEIDLMGDEIYDLMCESCWEKFRAEQSRLKRGG